MEGRAEVSVIPSEVSVREDEAGFLNWCLEAKSVRSSRMSVWGWGESEGSWSFAMAATMASIRSSFWAMPSCGQTVSKGSVPVTNSVSEYSIARPSAVVACPTPYDCGTKDGMYV